MKSLRRLVALSEAKQGENSPPAQTAPAAFGAGQWSVVDAAVGGRATVTISALPADGGSAITAIQYQVGAGAWTASGISSPGTFDINGLTNGASVNVKVRAVNAIGNGADSDVKSVTPSAGTLFAFTDTFADGANNADLSARSSWIKGAGGRSAQTTGASTVKHVAGAAPDTPYMVETGSPNHSIKTTIQTIANSQTFFLCLRMIDGDNYAGLRRNGNLWQLYVVTTTEGFISLGTSPQEVVIGDEIEMKVVGGAVSLTRNGAELIGSNISLGGRLSTATKAGHTVRASITPLFGTVSIKALAA
ncbi:fibronectin type III domain-containing protein [Agrobacterium tumefaciens]|uniref:fibronectin type III domain-containing protein n=1 Tax=Agrobacterium tumefaciens TaxID=358 RepID=UPI0021D02E6C|nr:fibronectin type III domain-containing protein [Agrobacterium tumefaciens]